MNSTNGMLERLVRYLQAQLGFLLVGSPGCAKSARIEAAARACRVPTLTTSFAPDHADASTEAVREAVGMRYIYGIGGRTCDLMDRLDAAGAVVPNVAEGVAESLPLRALRDVFECKVPAVWVWDEIGRAPLDVQGALCSAHDQLRRAGSPVVVVGATNRPRDKAGVGALSEQLRSRFALAFSIATHGVEDDPSGPVLLAPWHHAGDECTGCEVCGWVDWALSAGAPASMRAWHRSTKGRTLYAWQPHVDPAMRMPDFRSWETVMRLHAAGLWSVQDVAAAVGKPVAAEYLAYDALAQHLPTPDAVRRDPHGAPVPPEHEPAACYLVATILGSAVQPAWVQQFCEYIGRLSPVYSALAGRDAHRRLGADFVATAAGARWVREHAELFGTDVRADA